MERYDRFDCRDGIPLPIVSLNRWMLVGGVGLAVALRQPWIVAALLLILVSAVTFGPRVSLPFQVGTRVFPGKVREARRRGDVEDRRLMRFNNGIAIALFALSLTSFALGAPGLGWILAGMVALAAGVALCGFCLGCFLYYRFRLAQSGMKRAS